MELHGRIIGARYHPVPDEVVVKGLRADLDEEVGAGWFALVLFGDGRWTARGATAGVPSPSLPLLSLLQRMAFAMNFGAGNGGHWVLAYKASSNEMLALWRDGDGDLHAVVEFAPKPDVLLGWPDDAFAALGQSSVERAMGQIAKLEASPSQTYRRTLGERPH